MRDRAIVIDDSEDAAVGTGDATRLTVRDLTGAAGRGARTAA